MPCFGVGVVLVLAAVGLGFNNQNSPNPPPPQSSAPAAVLTAAPPTSPSPTDNSHEIATGTIYAPQRYSTIYVYSDPSRSSSVVASVANGATIGILCTAQGDVETIKTPARAVACGTVQARVTFPMTNQVTMTNC